MHTGNPRRTSAHTCALALHSLAPSRALFTVFQIALQWLVDVAAHKMTATSPKAGRLFHAERALLVSAVSTQSQIGRKQTHGPAGCLNRA